MLKKRMTAALLAAGMALALAACSSQEEQSAAQPEENAGVAVQVVDLNLPFISEWLAKFMLMVEENRHNVQ